MPPPPSLAPLVVMGGEACIPMDIEFEVVGGVESSE